MAQLGKPEKVVYTAKQLTTGLTDIKAYVMKPNGDIVGPFPLLEVDDNNFEGIYTFSFHTDSVNDEHGVYVGIIVSPSENHRTSFKLNYESLEINELNSMVVSIANSLALIKQADIELDLQNAIDEIEVEVGV